MRWVQPKELDELFTVFEQLEHGATIALGAEEPRIEVAPPPSSDGGAWLGVTSSGSTGCPKLVWKRWPALRAAIQPHGWVKGWGWASPFDPSSFAGVQVGLQAWATGGHAFTLPRAWDHAWALLERHRVEALCGTPTYLDLLLQNEAASGTDRSPSTARPAPLREGGLPMAEALGRPVYEGPRQVTLGGEVLRPAVGGRLAARFPRARVTVVYATAELGVLLKTHRLDGWYELEGLEHQGSSWRVEAGVLEVQRGQSWHSTGDLVELRPGLMRVVGRAGAIANVAGTKISLAEVSELAEQVPGVRRATAVAEPNPITGQIVCLRYALDPDYDAEAVTAALRAHLQSRLRKEAWPRQWVLDEVGPEVNAKRRL